MRLPRTLIFAEIPTIAVPFGKVSTVIDSRPVAGSSQELASLKSRP